MGTFILTDEQRDLQALAKEFADKEIRPLSAEYDLKGETPMDLYQKAAAMGFTAAAWPTQLGGLGLSYHTQAIVNEELSQVPEAKLFRGSADPQPVLPPDPAD